MKRGALEVASLLKDLVVQKLLAFTGTQKFLSIQLDITNACNLNCQHCYHPHHQNTGALAYGDWLKILDQYESLKNKLYLKPHFTICGGEPTISPIFLPLLNEINSRWPGVGITVLTNGTRLTQELVERLLPYNISFQISLDGPDSPRHDLIRGPGNFDKAIIGLKNLQNAGRNAWFLATLSYRTSFWIEEFFDTAKALNVEAMNFTRFISQGVGRKTQESGIDRPLKSDELRRAYENIIHFSRETGISTNTEGPLFVLLDPTHGANGKAGFQGLVVDYQGNLLVSGRTDYKLGNILEEGLEKLFLHHPLMEALRRGDIEGCGECTFYNRCGGNRNAAYAATGSFLTKDPACWLDQTNHHQKEVFIYENKNQALDSRHIDASAIPGH